MCHLLGTAGNQLPHIELWRNDACWPKCCVGHSALQGQVAKCLAKNMTWVESNLNA